MDIEFVLLDEVKEQIERSLEDLEVDFVIGSFQSREFGEISTGKLVPLGY